MNYRREALMAAGPAEGCYDPRLPQYGNDINSGSLRTPWPEQPPTPAVERPQLDSVEDALLVLLNDATQLRQRIGRAADRLIGPSPKVDATKPLGGAGVTSKDAPTLYRLQEVIRALRDELDGAHALQSRIETL